MTDLPGKTHRRRREALKRAVVKHRERVATKLARRAFLKALVKTLERTEDREYSNETHQSLIETKAKLRAVENQLRAFGDVDL